MGLPMWTWIVFYALVLLMLIADLKMFGRKGQHEVNVKEALQMTAVMFVHDDNNHRSAYPCKSGRHLRRSFPFDATVGCHYKKQQ